MPGLIKNGVFASMAFAVSSSVASACSYPLSSLDDKIAHADQIFIATLEEAKIIPGNYPTRRPTIEGAFRVDDTLKGQVQAAEIKLSTGLGGGDCGIPMIVSATYIIFKQRDTNSIWTPSGTSVIEQFQAPEVAEKIRSAVEKNKIKLK
jgi:hypothetical protein